MIADHARIQSTHHDGPFIDRAIFSFHFHGIFLFYFILSWVLCYYVHFIITGPVLLGSPL